MNLLKKKQEEETRRVQLVEMANFEAEKAKNNSEKSGKGSTSKPDKPTEVAQEHEEPIQLTKEDQ